MNLDELQSVRDRERQTDKLQQLRESFYADAGQFIQQLQTERDRAADRADDPFDAPEVRRLSDEISTAEQTVEAIYEKRVGKIVKAASFAAADLPAQADGMTAEEQELFDHLVGDIKANRNRVLDVLSGDVEDSPVETPDVAETDPVSQPTAGESPRAPVGEDATAATNEPADHQTPPEQAQPSAETGTAEGDPSSVDDPDGGGVSVADVMGGDAAEPTSQAPPPTDTESGRSDTGEGPSDGSPSAETPGPGEQPIRKDGGTGPKPETVPPGTSDAKRTRRTESPGTDSEEHASSSAIDAPAESSESGIERQTVRITDEVETFVGFDDRDYDLAQNDVVTLPTSNAAVLLDRGVAESLE